MARRLPRFNDGDQVSPWIFNLIFQELERLSSLTGSGSIGVDGGDGDGPPTIVDYREDPAAPPLFADSGIGFAAGSRATPASATVTLLKGSGGSPGGLDQDTGNTVVAYSMFTAAIGAGKTILLLYFNGTYYVSQVYECS